MEVNNSSKNKEKNNKLTSSTVESDLKEVSITKEGKKDEKNFNCHKK